MRDMNRKPYPTDVSDEEWAFIAPLPDVDVRRCAAAEIRGSDVQLLPVLALKQGVQHICKRVSMLPMT